MVRKNVSSFVSSPRRERPSARLSLRGGAARSIICGANMCVRGERVFKHASSFFDPHHSRPPPHISHQTFYHNVRQEAHPHHVRRPPSMRITLTL